MVSAAHAAVVTGHGLCERCRLAYRILVQAQHAVVTGHGLREVLLECASCGCQTSVTAGTIFHDARTPLLVWFRAMWWVTTQEV